MKDIEQLIVKWLAGECSPEEMARLATEVDLESLAATLKAQESLEISTKDSGEMWRALEAKRKIDMTQKVTAKPRIYWPWLLILGLVLSGLLYFFYPKKKQIKTAPKQEEEIHFADNTTIRLAPSSHLSWKEEDWEQNRVVNLDGQAFFDVPTKGSFIVNTEMGDIQVLGTSFDVWEIDKDRFRVQCFTGKVKVILPNGEQSLLEAGQQVSAISNTFSKVAQVTGDTPDWMSGRIFYDQVPFSTIFQELNRIYGLDVTSKDIDSSQRFNGALPSKNLEEALEIIVAVSGWTYEKTNETTLVFKAK